MRAHFMILMPIAGEIAAFCRGFEPRRRCLLCFRSTLESAQKDLSEKLGF